MTENTRLHPRADTTADVPSALEDADASLRSYVVAKHAVADAIRDARGTLGERDQGAADRLDELLARLAEDRFQLAVLGQFKRGKSSLINAVIGRELLPVGAVPLTSVVTALRYGPEETAHIRRQGWSFAEEVPVARLSEYVTEGGNPRNEKGVLSAEVEVPAPFLRRGLRFIDTPGVGSVYQRNTAITYEFLPEVDAAIFVTSVDAPLGDEEMQFLDAIREHVRKIFVVVNKIDQLGQDDRGELMAFVQRTLEARLAGARIFALSAREALASKSASDPQQLEQSGLPSLERALAAFLRHERARVFLDGLLERAVGSITDERRRVDPLDDPAIDELDRLTARLRTLQEALLRDEPLPALEPEPPTEREHFALPQTARPERPPSNAWSSSTCSVCAEVSRAVFDLMCRWQYWIATDVAARRAYAASGGFCSMHAWQLERVASAHGLSAGYPPLLDRTAAALRSVAGAAPTAARERIRDLSPGQNACRACRLRAEVEQRRCEVIVRELGQRDGREAFAASFGLCLAHLGLVVSGLSDDTAGEVLRRAARRLTDVAEAMREHVLKVDARRRAELGPHEDRAHRDGIVLISGEEGIR